MKTMNLKNLLMVAVFSVLAISVSAQRMHKQPRIKVKANKVEMNTQNSNSESTVTSNIVNEEVATTVTAPVQNETVSASTPAAVKSTKRNVISASTEVKESKSFDFTSFSAQLASTSQLMKVKEVKKTAMEKWVMWMIILFGAALLFTILGAIFFFSLTSGLFVLGYVFYIIGALCWLGGGVVLVLGLVGVI
jgi:hypothetical protein